MNLAAERELLADRPAALLERLDLLLLSGSMSTGLRDILSAHLEAIPLGGDGRAERVKDAITLIMASPDYQVQL